MIVVKASISEISISGLGLNDLTTLIHLASKASEEQSRSCTGTGQYYIELTLKSIALKKALCRIKDLRKQIFVVSEEVKL